MDEQRIRVGEGGPYLVQGGVPLARKQIVTTENDESITWRTSEAEAKDGNYALCRCGQSSNKPYCDGTHSKVEWDSDETAPTDTYAERAESYEGTGMVMKDDRGICEHAGFCGIAGTNVWKMMKETGDTATRAQAMGMIEKCPSGAITYEVDGEQLEPDLPVRIATQKDGPLVVTGGITVERSDGEPFETRNRMTLCRCGQSANKPLCDGSHTDAGFQAP